MGLRYLYIDDNLEHLVEGQVSGLNVDKKELEVVHRQPFGEWEAERRYFQDDFAKEFHGLILDLRLDDEANSKGKKSYYKGTSLAQELRTLSTEKVMRETPIVLLSAEAKIAESLDTTGKDLFDFQIPKERLTGDYFSEARNRLIALAGAYQEIADLKRKPSSEWLTTLLKIKSQEVDVRLVSKLTDLFQEPTHSLVSFFIMSFLSSDGPLLSEWTMAARLGIDRAKSKDWPRLLSTFSAASYTGILHEGWKRWWSFEFEKIISEWAGDEDFRDFDAAKRTEIIKQKTKLDELSAAPLLEYSQSPFYWTICRGTGLPIDPIDGLVICDQDNLYPWQERKYVSIYEALHRTKTMFWKDVAPSEIDRLARLQNLHRRERAK